MRIISGQFKGRIIYSNKGTKVRPTSDKVRGSVFNMLQFELEGKTFCDLFSGTGAIGIEALSRGVKFCTFVEANCGVATGIKKNLEKLGVSKDSYEMINKKVDGFLQTNKIHYDFIFMDPPYDKGFIDRSIYNILKSLSLCISGKIIVEHIITEKIDFSKLQELKVIKEKKHGSSVVTILGFKES